jgi:serine/threonine protein kinase
MRLGQGAFSTVFLGIMHHKEVAVKKLFFSEDSNKYEKEVELYFKEVKLMIELRHQNVVSLLGIVF